MWKCSKCIPQALEDKNVLEVMAYMLRGCNKFLATCAQQGLFIEKALGRELAQSGWAMLEPRMHPLNTYMLETL